MLTYQFDFGTKPIVIHSEKKVKDETQIAIVEFLQFVQYDFNADIHLSSAYRFNDVRTNTPVILTNEFCDYIKVNIKYASFVNSNFMPFYSHEEVVMAHNLMDMVKLNKQILIKTEQVFFDTKPLLIPFVIDTIFSMLVDLGAKGLVVESGNYISVDKKVKFKVDYELEDGIFYNEDITNCSIGFHFFRDYFKEKKKPQGFVNLDQVIYSKYVIFKTDSCIASKILSYSFKNFGLKSEYKMFASKYKIDLVVIDKDDNKHVFEKD